MADESPDDEELHDCRKKVKDMLYVIKWTDKKWEEAKEITARYNKDLLNELGDVLGDYNDLRNTESTLCSFEDDNITDEEQDKIDCLRFGLWVWYPTP